MTKIIIKFFTLVLMASTLVIFSMQHAMASSETKNYRALSVYSNQAIVVDQSTGETLYSKNADVQKPIASITKLMTAIVTLDANLPFNKKIQITEDDIDTLRNSRSRLQVGTVHSRRELLQLALMSSENRASSALARTYPGGFSAFFAAMNKKAKKLGMDSTHFSDATGLDSDNVSTARDLVKLVQASFEYSLIREITTTPSYEVRQASIIKYKNSNPLFKDKDWQIGLSKTGYIKPAGHCLVMQTEVVQKPLIIVLLDADAKKTVSADSNRIKNWFSQLLAAGKSALAAASTDGVVPQSHRTASKIPSHTASRVRAKFKAEQPLAMSSTIPPIVSPMVLQEIY